MKTRRARKAELLSLDIISTLPQPILETILCLLPTEEAARTSILSKEWRYKWTKIPKLEFWRGGRHNASKRKDINRRCKFLHDIHQVLLLHQGPIHELAIHICDNCDCLEFDQIIVHLSKNHTVKKLTVYGWDYRAWSNIPISVFSLHHLTDLYLSFVDLENQPVLTGICSLKSLVLDDVRISTETLLHLLSRCPSLKSFSLLVSQTHVGGEDCNITELFKCLPVVEHLTTYTYVFEWLVLDTVPQELPTLLFHLKSFCYKYVCFEDGYGLAFLFKLIKCSPNLEKIKFEIESDHHCMGEYSVVWEEYLDVWLEHLNELEILYFKNSKPEMEFVKFIMARSPKLKKVSLISGLHGKKESEMLKTLLEAPRASPVIITVK